MTLAARCHSLRPERNSGWLSFFELAPRGDRAAHFLVVGPADETRATAREAALRAGQVAVRYLKEVPESAPHLTVLEAVAQIVQHESQTSGEGIEFGAGVLVANQLWFLAAGRVRIAPLAPGWSPPMAAPSPVALVVTPATRLFFGRVPESTDERTIRDFVARLEGSGGGDGGLIATFVEGGRLRAVPGRPPRRHGFDAAPSVTAAPATQTELPMFPAEASAPPPPEALAMEPPPVLEPPVVETAVAETAVLEPAAGAPHEPEAREPESEPAAGPAEPTSFAAMLSELRESFATDAQNRPAPEDIPPPGEGAEPAPAEVEPAFESLDPIPEAEPPHELPTVVEEPYAGEPPVEAPVVARSASEDTLHASEDTLYAPEEKRGLGFWLGAVAALIALLAVAAYIIFLRPRVRESAPAAEQTAVTEMPSAAIAPGAATEALGLDSVSVAVLWEERFQQAVTSSPAVSDDRVVFGCRDGRVYALDRSNGHRIWAYAATQGFGSSPAVAGGLVVIGGYDGRIYGLDLATGEERWSVATGGRIVASPAADSLVAFVGSYDRSLYAVSLAEGRTVWTRDLGSVLWSSPVRADDLIIAAGLDGHVTAMEAANGRVRWQAACGGPVYSSPVVAERKVIVGSQDGNLYAFDLADGAVAWTIPGGAPVNGSPAYREGRVVVGTDLGTLLGVDVGMGRVVWRLATGGDVKARPAFLGRTAWVGGYDGALHGFEWLTGAEVARVALDSSAYSSPAIADGVAYLGVMDGRFLAIRLGLKTS